MVRRSYRSIVRFLWYLRRPWIRRRLTRTQVERLGDIDLVIAPGVHNPLVFRAGAFLAITAHDLLQAPRRGSEQAPMRALDLGTGSGIGAIVAARHGYHVIGVDINPTAVRCSHSNAARNYVVEHVANVTGDLFEPFADQSFDLVMFNPPFHSGKPVDIADAAWRSEDVLERFAHGLPRILRPGGQALLVFSTDGDERRLHRTLDEQSLSVSDVRWTDLGNEILTVYSVRNASEVVA